MYLCTYTISKTYTGNLIKYLRYLFNSFLLLDCNVNLGLATIDRIIKCGFLQYEIHGYNLINTTVYISIFPAKWSVTCVFTLSLESKMSNSSTGYLISNNITYSSLKSEQVSLAIWYHYTALVQYLNKCHANLIGVGQWIGVPMSMYLQYI